MKNHFIVFFISSVTKCVLVHFQDSPEPVSLFSTMILINPLIVPHEWGEFFLDQLFVKGQSWEGPRKHWKLPGFSLNRGEALLLGFVKGLVLTSVPKIGSPRNTNRRFLFHSAPWRDCFLPSELCLISFCFLWPLSAVTHHAGILTPPVLCLRLCSKH